MKKSKMKTRWMMIMAMVTAAGMAQASNWVTIGNPGNDAQSASNRAHTQSGGDGYGAVGYTYQISKYAVSIADWSTFYNDESSGKQGSFRSDYDYWNDGTRNVGATAPAVRIGFRHAAQYANWLTTGNASTGAYTINSSGDVTAIMSRDDILAAGTLYYVLPSEDEWFKAAYYNGTTEKYTLYAHGADTTPPKSTDGSTGWNYSLALSSPNQVWTVSSGTEEQNGTFNMMGNVWEWMEDSSGLLRGGGYFTDDPSSSNRSLTYSQSSEFMDTGFRVAAIPEPGAVLFLFSGLLGMAVMRRIWGRIKR